MKLPVGQSVQAAVPATSLNVPSAHGAHCPPWTLRSPVYPGTHSHAVPASLSAEFVGQTQSVTSVDPGGLVAPGGQVEHDTAAVALLYVSASHCWHVGLTASGAYVPGPQSEHPLAPAVLVLPLPQLAQSPADVPPVPAANVPGEQAVHSDMPSASAYVPGSQVEQLVVSVSEVAEPFSHLAHAVYHV